MAPNFTTRFSVAVDAMCHHLGAKIPFLKKIGLLINVSKTTPEIFALKFKWLSYLVSTLQTQVRVPVLRLFCFFLSKVTGCCPARWLHAKKRKNLSIAACKKEEKVTACCPARWLHKKRKNDRLQLGILGTVYAKNEKR